MSSPIGPNHTHEDLPDARTPPDLPGDAQRTRRSSAIVGLLAVLVLGTAVRATIVSRGRIGYLFDIDLFAEWTRSLHEHGLSGFYQATSFSDYPPLFTLTMWLIGHAATAFDGGLTDGHLLHVLLKIPACIGDLVIALTLFVEGRRIFGDGRAVGAAALYYLNPLSFYDSAYWGQVDSIHTAMVLLSVVFIARRRWTICGLFIGLAMLQKFQAIAFVPLILFEAYRYRRWRGLGACFLGAGIAACAVLAPFAGAGVVKDVMSRAYVGVVGQYHSLSPSAFNIWHLPGLVSANKSEHQGVGLLSITPDMDDNAVPRVVSRVAARGRETFRADETRLLRLTWRRISLIAYSIAVALILTVGSYRSDGVTRLASAALLGLAFFLIPTEMHERYAHPTIALLAVWAVGGVWKERVFSLLSVLLLLNLTWIQPVRDIAPEIAATIVLTFVGILVWIAVGQRKKAATAEVDAHAACSNRSKEPTPQPSRIISLFRWATYACTAAAIAACVAAVAYEPPIVEAASDGDRVYLSELTPVRAVQGWGELQTDASVTGSVIHIGDTVHMRGLGTHAPSTVSYDIPSGFDTFEAVVGIDSESSGGSATASVYLDEKLVFGSELMTPLTEPVVISVPLNGTTRLTLKTDPTPDGNTSDHVDWGSAMLRRGR
jgi:NPCBM/NEW2 domain/Glycosyltransferase family 87